MVREGPMAGVMGPARGKSARRERPGQLWFADSEQGNRFLNDF